MNPYMFSGKPWIAALAVVLLTAATASAQFNSANAPLSSQPPYYYGPGFYGYSDTLVNAPPYRGVYMTSINYPGIYGPYFMGPGTSFYHPGTGPANGVMNVRLAPAGVAQPAANVRAYIDVTLPADAQLFFEGVRTDRTGPYRQFVSPPLTPGRHYLYDITAKWDESGRQVSRQRTVRVAAGERVNVDFTGAPTSQPARSTLQATPTLPPSR